MKHRTWFLLLALVALTACGSHARSSAAGDGDPTHAGDDDRARSRGCRSAPSSARSDPATR